MAETLIQTDMVTTIYGVVAGWLSIHVQFDIIAISCIKRQLLSSLPTQAVPIEQPKYDHP